MVKVLRFKKFLYALKAFQFFYKNIKETHITLKKAEEKQKEFKLEINEIVKGGKTSKDPKSVINIIKTTY